MTRQEQAAKRMTRETHVFVDFVNGEYVVDAEDTDIRQFHYYAKTAWAAARKASALRNDIDPVGDLRQ